MQILRKLQTPLALAATRTRNHLAIVRHLMVNREATATTIRGICCSGVGGSRCYSVNTPSGGDAGSRIVVEKLTERALVRVQGAEVVSFLQGLITNDMQHLDEQRQPPAAATAPNYAAMYAMLLNKAGRVQYDTIVYRTPEPNRYLIECDRSVSDELCRHLRVYRVRRRIDIESADDELNVWAIFNAGAQTHSLNINPTPHDVNNTFHAIPDPRLRQLGWRVLSAPDVTWQQLAENAVHTKNSGSKDGIIAASPPTDNCNYRVQRYRYGVGEGVLDLPPGKCFPLESNCDFLHGVSFHKGCYIGQELTARVHHTGVVRKRLMPLLLSPTAAQTTTPTSMPIDASVLNETGNKVGTLRGVAHEHALALMRVDVALKAKQLQVDGKACSIEKPEWWAVESPTRATMCDGR